MRLVVLVGVQSPTLVVGAHVGVVQVGLAQLLLALVADPAGGGRALGRLVLQALGLEPLLLGLGLGQLGLGTDLGGLGLLLPQLAVVLGRLLAQLLGLGALGLFPPRSALPDDEGDDADDHEGHDDDEDDGSGTHGYS